MIVPEIEKVVKALSYVFEWEIIGREKSQCKISVCVQLNLNNSLKGLAIPEISAILKYEVVYSWPKSCLPLHRQRSI